MCHNVGLMKWEQDKEYILRNWFQSPRINQHIATNYHDKMALVQLGDCVARSLLL